MPRDEYGLTPRQRAFCDYYIESGNLREAAIRAGYSKRSADVIAGENINKPQLKQYIAERMKPDEDRRIASADEVLQFLSDVMAGKVKDQFGLDASLQDRIKRYAVADMRQQTTMQRLDSLFVEFRAALSAAPEPQTEATEGSTQGTATEASSAPDTAPEPA